MPSGKSSEKRYIHSIEEFESDYRTVSKECFLFENASYQKIKTKSNWWEEVCGGEVRGIGGSPTKISYVIRDWVNLKKEGDN